MTVSDSTIHLRRPLGSAAQRRRERSPGTGIRIAAALSILTLAAVLLGLPLTASVAAAQEGMGEASESVEVSEKFRKAMRAYLESQGAYPQIGQGVAYQVANETLMMIASSGAQVTEQMQTIVLEEALATYEGKFSDLDFLTSLWAPVYAKHFSAEELEAITQWFRSELGRKVVSLSQTLNEEGMAEVQKASLALSPEFQLAVDARFREAGLVSDAPAEP